MAKSPASTLPERVARLVVQLDRHRYRLGAVGRGGRREGRLVPDGVADAGGARCERHREAADRGVLGARALGDGEGGDRARGRHRAERPARRHVGERPRRGGGRGAASVSLKVTRTLSTRPSLLVSCMSIAVFVGAVLSTHEGDRARADVAGVVGRPAGEHCAGLVGRDAPVVQPVELAPGTGLGDVSTPGRRRSCTSLVPGGPESGGETAGAVLSTRTVTSASERVPACRASSRAGRRHRR